MNPGPAFELTPASAAAYLARRERFRKLRIVELAGGVSNTVLLIETGAARFVLKQSLPQLRVAQEWLSDRARIFREAAALQALAPCLPPGAVPAVLFEDRENYLFGMTAAPDSSETWKSALLRGECDPRVAVAAAEALAGLMWRGWQSDPMRDAFGDLRIFRELRLDPYYRTVAERCPEVSAKLIALEADYPRRACTLVHGDFSPKNLLVCGADVMAIDFEAIHFGDPGFDAAFLLNHLRLKSFRLPRQAGGYAVLARVFWETLVSLMPPVPNFERRTIEHLGALLLARIDGKSPVEYIRDPALKQHIREFARSAILHPPSTVLEFFR
jgi:5-methylthioribose kinase